MQYRFFQVNSMWISQASRGIVLESHSGQFIVHIVLLEAIFLSFRQQFLFTKVTAYFLVSVRKMHFMLSYGILIIIH